MPLRRFKPTMLSALIATIAWPAAHAQNAQPAAAPAQPAELEQVIVTSQKRKENLKQVPLSVSVVTGEAIQDNHISDVTDLSRAVPNLSFSSQGGAGLSNLEMRGVSSQAGQATVSIYLDDISLTTRNIYSQGAAEPRFFDIDRVEVLRGPQGTLYGASSLGGTIKFISRQPDLAKFSGDAYGELSSTSHGGTNHVVQSVLNVPLVAGSTALRIGLQDGHDSGYIDRVDPASLKVIEKGINSTNWDVLKLALKSDFGRGWSVTPALFQQRYKANDIDTAYLSVGQFQLPQGSTATPPDLGLFQTSKPLREPSNDKLQIPSITLNGDVGFGDFTGIISGYKRRFDRIQDGTSVNVPYIASQVADPVLSNTVYGLPSAVQLANKVDQTSIELRVTSKEYDPARSPFTWIGGVYVARTKTQVYDNEPVFGINAAFKAAGGDINDPNQLGGSFPGAFTGDSSYYSARHYNDRQTSFFGEATYHMGPALRAIGGLRVMRASQHFTREGDQYYAGGPSSAVIDADWHPVTPRFAVDWDMNKETTLYGNVAKGFRLGAANRPIPDPSVNPLVGQDLAALNLPGKPPASFDSDSLWSYEIGSKSRLLDNRLGINLAAFYIDWKNIQQNVTLPASGFDFETNVGRAKSYGFEAEGRFRINDAWIVNAAYGYTHAEFAEDTPALGTDSNGVLNARKGDPVQGVPQYSARLGFEYRFFSAGEYETFIRGNGAWTGSSYGTFVRDQKDYRRPGYFTADVSAGFDYQRWEFSLFVKNAFNNHKIIQQPSIQSVSEALYLRPRTIGLTGHVDF